MTIENDIDLLVSGVTTSKAAVVKAKADLDAIVAEGASVAGQAATVALAALSARDEASAMATSSGALATASVGATAYADLAAVATSKVESAVDVFIYDTSLDGDGGAWRYRTQGTSWYRETLNTATRGSRREFPAVAVIVAEANRLTIFDGDDPALPMWIVFDRGAGLNALYTSADLLKAISAINGVIAFAGQTLSGASTITFDEDVVRSFGTSSLRTYRGGIGTRNDGLGHNTSPVMRIISDACNDVAMTVLPDAPINPATGLPVPTIAVATDGGVSVIKDDGNVWDITDSFYINVTRVEFYGDMIYAARQSSAPYWSLAFAYKIPSADVAISAGSVPASAGVNLGTGFFTPDNTAVGARIADGQFGSVNGLRLIGGDPLSASGKMWADAGAGFTTGWMPGDIKGAWLADIEADDLRKVELMTNGGFDTADGWTLAEYASIAGGFASWSNAPHNDVFLSRGGFSVVAGKQYLVEYDQTNVGSSTKVYMDFAFTTVASNASRVSQVVVASGTASNSVKVLNSGTGGSGTIDNISITPLEQDRAVSRKGLSIFGRLRRAPVADGAELVAYSGFSAENYLEGTDASYVDTLYALGWEQTNGRWEFKHGVVSSATIDGLTVMSNTVRIAGTKPKALIRLTATIPTADHLAKIERDELALFQPGAQCTLYGASDTVTALAHDRVTNLLHVGTSAGRSVFDGLRRVAHTTAPVGAAIAAHNGLIIED